MKNLDKKCYGKFRKTKAYGLVGCLAFSGFLLVSGVGGEDAHAAVVNGGSDIVATDVHSKEASGVAMTYTTFDSNGSKQVASGSGVFVAPNVMVTVAHNYLDKNKEAGTSFVRGGSSATSYVVMNSESAKRGNNTSSGYDDIIPKGNIHYYNDKEFVNSYSGDLAAVVTEKPVEAMTNGEDHARDLGTARQGDKVAFMGYPNDFSSKRLSEESKAKLVNGKMYKVSGTLSSLDESTGSGIYNTSALGGFSGGPIFNERGEVVGIHQHGTNTDAGDDSSQHGGGLFFTDKHRAWINKMIEEYGTRGWFVNGNDKYYYDDNHKAVVNTERTIDGAKYRFDANGRGTLLSGVEKGKVVLRIKDTNGSKLYEKIVSEGNVGTPVSFNFKQDNDVKSLFAKNPEAIIVSADGQEFNKKFSDNWSKDYVSKLALGNTYFDVVVRVDKFERTVSGQVDGSGGVNLPKMDDKVRNAPNGERNFGATAIIRTPDGSGSGTLISNDLVLTVAHNFLKFEDGKVIEKAKGNSDKKYYMALPNGKKVFFTDSDIHYWKKDDSVVGFTHDLALIKLREVIDDAQAADVVTSVPTVNNGDKVSVYGYPDGKMGPVIDTTVTDVVDRGAGLTGIGYTGTKPGASGGGLYNDKGEIIGVHQNGVVNQRSGGLVFSKEQLDWVRSYVNGKPEAPVYKVAEQKEDPKTEAKVDYTLDKNPYLIVDETKDMQIEKDPGLVKALEAINSVKGHDEWVKEARKKIEKLMNMKTGVVYKVRSHEANGKDGWRYFRTWTSYDINSGGTTEVPYVRYTSNLISGGIIVAYYADENLPYGKGRIEDMSRNTDKNNVAIVRWVPNKIKNEGGFSLPLDILDFEESVIGGPRVYIRYEGDVSKEAEHGGSPSSNIYIGTKPEITEEVIRKRGVKYVRNGGLNKLGLKERVIKEGSDEIKRITKFYILLSKLDKDKPVKGRSYGLFDTKGTIAPSVENGGVKVEETVTYTNLEDKVIEVATPGDKVVEKILEPEIGYISDPTRERGTSNVVTLGSKGKSVTTITYTVDPKTGEVVENAGTSVITPAGKTIVKVGTKEKVVTKVLEPEVEYVRDDTRKKGTLNEVIPGTKGSEKVTTTYTVNPKTGDVTEVVGKPVITPAGKIIIKVGTQEEIVTEPIEPTITYVGNGTRVYGSEHVVKKGTPGYKKKITEYDLNPKTGAVTPKERVEIVAPRAGTVITVGTKPKLIIVKRGTETYEVRTEYTVDPKTGRLAEKVTEKLLYKVGDDISVEIPEGHGVLSGNGIDENGNPIASLVVKIPEYIGVISGNGLNGVGGVIVPPVVDIPEYKGVLSGNGLDGDGNIIEPPVVEAPEYTGGVLSGNGLDGGGGMIEPPVVNIPEYKGDISNDNNVKKDLPKVVSVPQGKGEKVLPNTGSEGNHAGLGLGVIAVGAVMVKQRRKLGKR